MGASLLAVAKSIYYIKLGLLAILRPIQGAGTAGEPAVPDRP